MRLRRFEVKNFRKLGHEVVEGIQDGLNVIVGDNEAGKSTLLAAMRAALFERHRVTGATADEMQPFGESVRPEVWLDFEIKGQSWKLHKAFCQKPEATLTGPDGRITGDQVEERLAELLGFTPPGKGGSDPEKHHGAYSLLWVEQGQAHQSLRIGAGRESVASAIENEVGQVMGGERGRALLASAEKRKAGFWTKTERARGEWKDLQEEIVGLQDHIGKLELELASYDDKVDDLDRKQTILGRYREEKRLERAQQALEEAVRVKAETDQLAQIAREAATQQQLALVERDNAKARLETRQRLVVALDAAGKALEAARSASDEVGAVLESRRTDSDEAVATLATRRVEHARLAARATAIEATLSRRRAREELGQMEARRKDCETAETARREARAAADAITITQDRVEALEKLQEKVDQARVRLQAASVRIAFTPEGARSASLDGTPLDPSSDLRIGHDAELVLEGYGRLRIQPGGGVDELARAAGAAEQALKAELTALGLPSLSKARSELQRKAALLKEAGHQKSLACLHAPDGLEALLQAIDSRRRLIEASLPQGATEVEDATEIALLEARQARDAAASAVRSAEDAAAAADKERLGAERDVATYLERVAGRERDHEEASSELAGDRDDADDQALQDLLATKEEALSLRSREEAAARTALEAADPEVVCLTWEQARDSEKQIRAEMDDLDRAASRLRIELETLGRDGVGEQLADLQGRLAFKTKQVEAREQEAAATKLLYDVLSQAQRESKDRWLGPVRQRVEPYLRILHPNTDIVLHDDTLELDGFIRNGKKEPFVSLSMGAREQVAVITRIALADILRGTGQPSVVILDDALVNTDEERLRRMHLVLRKASENLQVLIMTCRERDFYNIGGRLIRLH